jgi:hypothetical protein
MVMNKPRARRAAGLRKSQLSGTLCTANAVESRAPAHIASIEAASIQAPSIQAVRRFSKRSLLLQHAFDICLREVVADIEQRATALLRNYIRKAVTAVSRPCCTENPDCGPRWDRAWLWQRRIVAPPTKWRAARVDPALPSPALT